MPDTQAAQITRIVAVRHGETAWNVDSRIQGQLDIPLNDTGTWQARRVADALRDEGLETLYTSDLQRARQTADAVALSCGLEPRHDRGLRERSFGSFEGRTWSEIEQRWPVESERWRRRDPGFAPPGGETLESFYARCIDCATQLAQRHAGQAIALVAHGGVLDCLYRAATRLDLRAPRSWQLGNASINRLLYTSQGFTLVGWADTGHLDAAQHDEYSDGGTFPGLVGRAA
jgi:2,3-bisphosphoglycerate-dependent phosphoglycerate mutase